MVRTGGSALRKGTTVAGRAPRLVVGRERWGADATPRRRPGMNDGRECDDLTVRMMLSIGCMVVAASGGAAMYAHRGAAPACDSDQVQGQVSRLLHDQFHL